MTIMEALSSADRLKPNQIDKTEKVKWLSELDGRIHNEIIDSYGKGDRFGGYADGVNLNTELIVREPYDSLYIYWLIWHVESALNEQGNANNTYIKFESTLNAFKKWYVRTHRNESPRIKLWR